MRAAFRRPTNRGAVCRIPRQPEEAPALLSFAQERFWFLQQLNPDSAAYNEPEAIRLLGALDHDALTRAVREIVRRHEVLRATFRMCDGQVCEVVDPSIHLRLSVPVIDLMACPSPRRESEIQRWARAEARRPFDLGRELPWRLRLLQLGAAEHVLLLTMHHVVSDGSTLKLFTRELATLYTAIIAGRPSPLSEPLLQYRDYAHWQRQWFESKDGVAQLAYWTARLADAPPLLALPSDMPRPALQTLRGARHAFTLDLPLTLGLKRLGQRERVTLFMLLLAAFKVLLFRYTAQSDIVVGAPVTGRTRPELEGLIGCFVNTLALRTDLAGNPSFAEVVRRVRRACLDAYAQQDAPFEKLVEALQPARNLSHSPLFQVMFTLDYEPAELMSPPGLRIVPLESDTGAAKFDLTLRLRDTPAGLQGVLEYNSDLFENATIRRLRGHFETLLAGIVADPARAIADLPLLTAPERHQLVVEWKAGGAPPVPPCIYDWFGAQVERTPDAVAVIWQDQQLRYRELDRRAAHLARQLQVAGVGPEVAVGLCVDRSPDLVVSVLAIMRAGGAYVALDPGYPAKRLAAMLEDARPPVVVTQRRLVDRLPLHGARIICIDDLPEVDVPPLAPVALCPANLAYVIYTSGSTGRPKGIAITQGSVVALIAWAGRVFTPAELAGTLASTSICFDLSVFELLVPLAYGGAIILAGNLLELPQLEAADRVTLINTVPSAMVALLEAAELPPGAGTINLAGEPLAQALVEQLYRRPSVRRVLNLFGPSEDTTYSTYAEVAPGSTPPIGRPIDHTRCSILDPALQPVPIGIAGELYLGGAGQARGYPSHPDLTAERFIPDPFSATPGARLYKTGDLARYRADGEIQFVGRIDHQVKLRGFRIELGEIEAALERHPAIREAVAVVRADGPDGPQLAAYIAARDGCAMAHEEVGAFLRDRLPAYMLPNVIETLPALPRFANGKLDRAALPPPAATSSGTARTVIAPRDTLELQLVHIWECLLKRHPIGVTDNFFDLGGHSLLAMRLMSELNRRWDRSVPVSALFGAATVEQLAVLLRASSAAAWSPLAPIQPNGSKQPLFCVHPIDGSVICYAALARCLDAERPIYGLEATGLASGQQPHAAIEPMASAYIEAIQAVQPRGPYLIGGWSFGGVVAFEIARQLCRQGHEVSRLVLFDSRPPVVAGRHADVDEARLLAQFTKNMTGVWQKVFGIMGKTAHVLRYPARRDEIDAQLRHLLHQTRTAALVPPDADLTHMRRLWNVWSAHTNAFSHYAAQPCAVPALLFQANSRSRWQLDERAHGWQRLCSGPFEHRTVAGTHHSMLAHPRVQGLAAQLRACLDE